MHMRAIIKPVLLDQAIAQRDDALEIVQAKGIGRAQRGDDRRDAPTGIQFTAGRRFQRHQIDRVVEMRRDAR